MGTDNDQPFELRNAAAEYASGDLAPEQSNAFAQLAAAEPAIDREAHFWSSLHQGLAPRPADPAWAPGRSFCHSLWQRLDWEQTARGKPRAVAIPLPRWLGAVLAAGLGVVIGWRFADGGPGPAAPTAISAADLVPVAYQDDGGTVVSPAAQHVQWAHYMPRGSITQIDTTKPCGASQPTEQTMKPWLGVWTKPVDLEMHDGKSGHGHLVLRVANGGPAGNAGIRPGDVILTIDHCPVVTPHCIADHLVKAEPGDDLVVEYWSAQTATVSEIKLTLGCVCE